MMSCTISSDCIEYQICIISQIFDECNCLTCMA